ncbi:MAG: type II toxin-antitoxin system VapC family toxin [Candidatus Hinthialibacter antarcticus]|nr:type II toxin-antitoxin system VapC family toxin [Candidatus Hinthialibacter antarcticus]
MQQFVLDCSATMSYFFKDETPKLVDAAFETLANSTRALVPSIWPLEIANTCLCAERRKRLTPDDTDVIYSILAALPIQVDTHTNVIATRETVLIARKYKLTAYDAAYLELARRENLSLLSLDKKLKQSAAKAGIKLWAPAS